MDLDSEASHAWDLKGGRHCPSYVRGWDPDRGIWVERIYYAGGAANVWDPYGKVFDFCVILGQQGFEAVFSRVWLGQGTPPPTTGLWWCQAKTQYSEADPDRMLVFFDGLYRKNERGPFPYVFTLGCLEIHRPEVQSLLCFLRRQFLRCSQPSSRFRRIEIR
jgi:hypothetical protein